jgi:hypothetical protein
MFVQVVLLYIFDVLYQGYIDEDDLKYGDRDITSGSLVSCYSKDNMAGGEPLPEQFGNQTFITFILRNHYKIS